MGRASRLLAALVAGLLLATGIGVGSATAAASDASRDVADLADTSPGGGQSIATTTVAQATGTPPVGAATAPSTRTGTAPQEEAVARALERTLVLQGALLVPFGQFEIQPELNYSGQSSSALQIVSLSGTPTITQSVRRDTLEPSLTLRAGLPFEAQADVFVPYVDDREEVVPAGSTTQQSRHVSGIGDVSFGLSKQFLHERGAIPDLIGSVRYSAATGSMTFNPVFTGPNVSTGSGFDSLQLQATATKRLDPLVYFASLSYSVNFSTTSGGTKVDPGNTTEPRIGAVLAVSPEASLSADVDLTFADATKFNGTKVAGSDQIIGFLDFGGSVVLTRSILLNLTAGVGLTQNSPNFRILASLPIRF